MPFSSTRGLRRSRPKPSRRAGKPKGRARWLRVIRWADTTPGAHLDMAGTSTDEVYAAMDWLAGREEAIETKLAAKHLPQR